MIIETEKRGVNSIVPVNLLEHTNTLYSCEDLKPLERMVNIPVLQITLLEIAVLNSAKNYTLLNTVQDYAKNLARENLFWLVKSNLSLATRLLS